MQSHGAKRTPEGKLVPCADGMTHQVVCMSWDGGKNNPFGEATRVLTCILTNLCICRIQGDSKRVEATKERGRCSAKSR